MKAIGYILFIESTTDVSPELVDDFRCVFLAIAAFLFPLLFLFAVLLKSKYLSFVYPWGKYVNTS